jgi:3'(2'), 5'-bisphosphate nucleotidase
MSATLEEMLPEIIRLTDEAGDKIMGIFRSGFEVRNKDDNSPVTEADEASERIIIEGLKALAPAIPIVAEESMAGGIEVDIGSGTFWLVDPLDGTREFINRREEFTVNIALIKDKVPILGVVGVPARDSLYYGTMSSGAKARKTGKLASISARRQPNEGAVLLASRSHGDKNRVKDLLETLPGSQMQILGSSLKFCLLAEGVGDIYPRFGHTMEWDTAAGDAVLRSAGGSVRLLDGTPLKYGKEHFLNADFIARGLD